MQESAGLGGPGTPLAEGAQGLPGTDPAKQRPQERGSGPPAAPEGLGEMQGWLRLTVGTRTWMAEGPGTPIRANAPEVTTVWH